MNVPISKAKLIEFVNRTFVSQVFELCKFLIILFYNIKISPRPLRLHKLLYLYGEPVCDSLGRCHVFQQLSEVVHGGLDRVVEAVVLLKVLDDVLRVLVVLVLGSLVWIDLWPIARYVNGFFKRAYLVVCYSKCRHEVEGLVEVLLAKHLEPRVFDS